MAQQLEDLIKATGGCGRYQIILAVIVHSMKCVVCFSLLFMVYGAVTPNWWCVEEKHGNVTLSDKGYKTCTFGNGTRCSRFKFEDTAKTIVTEWSLVCGNEWIPSLITSLQMAGVFVGNLACGHVADLIGRKPPLFLSLLAMVISNTAAAFSSSWIIFAIIRFFIGIEIGFELTVQYNIMSEFTLARWRTWVVAIPSWAIEVSLFAVVSWLVNDWQNLHFVTAAIGVPFLATYWFVPESFRWYVSHDRIKDAENAIKRVARINGKPQPDLSYISQISTSTKAELKDRKYSIIDILRNKNLRKYTLLLVLIWIVLGMAGYGMQFGVSALSGNIYINMFIIGLIGSPVQVILIPLQNRFGRKKTTKLFLAICAIFAFIFAITRYFDETEFLNKFSNAAALISLTAINASWSPIQTLTIEIYPTVVRNIGYGFQNTMARIGAIIGPQLVYVDTKVPGMMYWICGITAVISIFLLWPIPETMGLDLTDKLGNVEEQPNNEIIIAESRDPSEVVNDKSEKVILKTRM